MDRHLYGLLVSAVYVAGAAYVWHFISFPAMTAFALGFTTAIGAAMGKERFVDGGSDDG